MTQKTEQKHGGARVGAGRKPKALRYADQIAASEEKIIAAMPDLIDGLIRAATGGQGMPPDTAAAKYLIDRVFGRVKEQSAPLAEDMTAPIDPEQWEESQKIKDAFQASMNKAAKSMCA